MTAIPPRVARRLASRLRPRGDEGSMAFFLIIAIVGLAITALLMPMVVTSSRITRSDTSRVHALDAAQAGINVMVGKIRAATSDSVGTSTLLPCRSTSGTVASAGNATYDVRVDYYMSDPVAAPGTLKMTCLNGYGTYDPISDTFTPKFARITSVGKDGAASNGSTPGRTLATTYVFKTTNTNIVGGRIQIGAAADATSLLCMDAGSAAPLAATAIKLQVCATPPQDQQIFAYRSDLTLQLLSSVSGTYPNGLCVDTAPPPASGGAIVLNPCAVLGSPSYTQQWSYNDNGGYTAALPTSAATGQLSGQCITVASQTAGTSLTLAGCGGGSQGWIPSPVVGAGAAQAPQLVNFYEFGRCLDVTNQDPNIDHLIDYPCKQNPSPGAVKWNQKFATPGIAAGATSAVGPIITNPGSNYCLTSPGTEGGYVTVTPCSATNARQTWTVYNGSPTLAYSVKYTIVDNTGRCLGAYAPKGGEVWSAPDVRACTGDTKQKWNATADLSTSTLRDLDEIQ